jgi:integrase
MPKIAKLMSALEVKRLTEPKLHAVGGAAGLCLSISATGARSWILRTTIAGRRSDVGLGSYSAVTLAEAREKAHETLRQIRSGADPIAARRAGREHREWTFEACALAYIEAHEKGWRNEKHGQQWRNSLTKYVYPVCGKKHVRDVSQDDVSAVIRPFWTTKNETINRVRNRIELVLDWATASKFRPEGQNPAKWRGLWDKLLSAPSKVNKRKSFEALPMDEMHAFLQHLRAVEGMSARALEFVIFTACRSGEARGALWTEIDLDEAIWNIPAERMKANRPHRVPLCADAIALLNALPRFEKVDLVFPGRSGQLSDMSLTAVMRRMKLTAVPHGFRSTFTDWCSERTSYPVEVREMALAHAIGNQTEAAYRRGDLLEKRRALMRDWATFLRTPPRSSAVVPMRARTA